MGKTKTTSVGCNPFGCVTIILAVMFLWAFVFGVTYGGKHYDVKCSRSNGVDVETTRRGP